MGGGFQSGPLSSCQKTNNRVTSGPCLRTNPELPCSPVPAGSVGGYVLDSLLDAPDFYAYSPFRDAPLAASTHVSPIASSSSRSSRRSLKGTQCHVAFCCLGTTMKQAGSERAFREIDHDLVLSFARAAKAARAQRFVVVSRGGARIRARRISICA